MAREIYFEHQVVGRYAKVTAIDSLSRVEVSVFGPSSANPRDLETVALRKLEARLASDRQATPPRPPSGNSRLA